MCRLTAVSGVDGLVSRNIAPRTMSGGEPSSIKRTAVCAARVPGQSWLLLHRHIASFEYGCAVLPRIVFYFALESR